MTGRHSGRARVVGSGTDRERERERAWPRTYVHTPASRITLSEATSATIFATSIDPPRIDRVRGQATLSMEQDSIPVTRITRYPPFNSPGLFLKFHFFSKIGRSDTFRGTISHLLASVRGRIHTHIRFDWIESRSERDL